VEKLGGRERVSQSKSQRADGGRKRAQRGVRAQGTQAGSGEENEDAAR